MSPSRCLLAVLSVLLPICVVLGQDNIVQFDHINIEDGLSQGSVYCVTQDQKGFLWFGTQDGLNKYDGYEFTIYRHAKNDSSSLSDNCINAMREDLNGNLWIGTLSGGLNKLDRRTNQFKSFRKKQADPEAISSNTITSIFEDHSGSLWVGTDNGLNLMQGEVFVKFVHDESTSSISGDNITCMYEDSRGKLWIGTTRGLNLYDRQSKKFQRISLNVKGDQVKNNHITSLYEDKKANLFIGTNGGGVFQSNLLSTNQTLTFNSISFQGIIRNEVSSILSDPYGNIWIGYQEEGLIRWNLTSNEHLNIRTDPVVPASLSNDLVSTLFFDKFGNLWVGTLNGINKLNITSKKFSFYQNKPGVPGQISNSIFALSKDSAGNIWTGTRGGLFMRNDKQQTTAYTHQSGSTGAKDDAIRSIHIDDQQQIWIGTEKGTLETVDPMSKRFQPIEIDPQWRENPIYVIRQDCENILWLGTAEGLYSLDPNSKKIKSYDWLKTIQTATNRKEIRSLEIDKGGNLWIGTRGAGLLYFDKLKETFTNYQNNPKDSNSISSNVIACIYLEETSGTVWLGTASGFNKFNTTKKSFNSYTEKDGLPNDVVYGILPDNNGVLWLSTNNGVGKFNIKNEMFTKFDASDGLQGSEFNAGAYYRSNDGELFFGGINGYNSFYPKAVKSDSLLPEVVLTGLKVLNEDVSLPTSLQYTDSIKLTHDDYVFSLEFSAIHLTAPEKNLYAYMLKGFDKDWVYTQRRFATYTNLDPGTYTFKVKASNNDGIWNDNGLSITIVITPPFWQTLWFYVLITLLVGSITWAIYKSRVAQIRKEEKLKTEFNKKLAEVEMTALRAQMNPHFLFNCLNSINRFIVRNDSETASGYLTKFSRLIRLILQNSKFSTIPLQSELEALKLYIELEEIRFENRFEYSIEIDDAVEVDFVEVPPLLLQPYVENAIWHGLMHKEAKGKLLVQIKRDGDWLRCVIQDNGIGREKAQQLKSKSATRDKSLGMKITTDRLTLFQKQTEVQVIDLTDSDGTSLGTKIVVGIPYAIDLQQSPVMS